MFGKKLSTALAAGAIFVGGVAGASASQLITNGGFETGDFTGWTVFADSTFVSPSGYITYAPHSGNYFAALGTTGGDGVLSQTVADTTGQSYDLTYFLASNGASPSDFSVAWDGTTLPGSALTDPNSSGSYVEYSFLLTGTGSDTLAISERDDPGYMALDDVSLTGASATPLPAALPLFATGLGALGLFGWRRKRKAIGSAA